MQVRLYFGAKAQVSEKQLQLLQLNSSLTSCYGNQLWQLSSGLFLRFTSAQMGGGPSTSILSSIFHLCVHKLWTLVLYNILRCQGCICCDAPEISFMIFRQMHMGNGCEGGLHFYDSQPQTEALNDPSSCCSCKVTHTPSKSPFSCTHFHSFCFAFHSSSLNLADLNSRLHTRKYTTAPPKKMDLHMFQVFHMAHLLIV